MVSEWKRSLRWIGVAALTLGSVSLATGVLARLGLVHAEQAQPMVLFCFFSIFPVWFVAVALFAEAARASQGEQPWYKRTSGLPLRDLTLLVTHCPQSTKFASLTLAAIGFLLALACGPANWTEGQTLSSAQITSFGAAASVFHFLAAPVLSSASRLPCSLAAHMRSNDA